MLVGRVLAIASFLALSLADVSFTSPAAGESIVGTTINIQWTDGEQLPELSSLETYELFLCAGGNSAGQYIQLAALKNAGHFSNGNSISATIDTGIGANFPNAYFLKIISNGPTGSVINYSTRFSIPSMTGTFPPQVLVGLERLSGTYGPPAQNQAVIVRQAADPFAVPYLSQTGPIRYAPRAKVPGTKITVKAASTLFPTFSHDIFTAPSGPPDATTTVTQPETVSFKSVEATMSAAAMPFDSNVAQFLQRWAF